MLIYYSRLFDILTQNFHSVGEWVWGLGFMGFRWFGFPELSGEGLSRLFRSMIWHDLFNQLRPKVCACVCVYIFFGGGVEAFRVIGLVCFMV